ncbi:hypothetical protein XH83_22210 [Bradyrhizobium sp. CCBAU 53351]|uniref:DUF4405 domain-containing protein n=1 Tax=Bradyrhizobium sp. CCBAU 53351 TaxID=1325114 RepID=UPI00188975A4|nr:DUF4405 domain-containing protein [Bradyrhizobium sp. CCBAU 53351]QOZ77910.1 hypothetical protein XH83_22210 [Bradyrhizobium sp. CCBAU 53351]
MAFVFVLRLMIAFMAAGLLLIGLAYYWLDNAIHELVGAAMFLLVIVHNVFNRRWYSRIAGTREVRGLINTGVTVLLLITMLVLLITSVLISRSLSGFMPLDGGFKARQIHTLAAYWSLVIVAIHLGLRWSMIMGVARSLLGVSGASAIRTVMLRAIAVVVAAHGVWSSFELGVGTKLSMQMTLDWWNFEESVAAFFIHCMTIAGLYVVAIYYATNWLRPRKAWDRIRAA